jgi:hypothetical protein
MRGSGGSQRRGVQLAGSGVGWRCGRPGKPSAIIAAGLRDFKVVQRRSRGLVVLFLLLDPCLQFRKRVSIYSHGPSGMYALDEPDIASATSPVPAGAGDPDTPMRMPGLCVGQRIVFYIFCLQFPGSPRRASSFRVRVLHPSELFRSSGLWVCNGQWNPFPPASPHNDRHEDIDPRARGDTHRRVSFE